MNNDEKFINDVWFKYNSYKQYIVKDTFFKKHHYKNNNIKRYLHATISFGFSIIITVGIVYASTKGFDFNQKNATIDYVEHIGQDYNQEMQCSNGIYYTKIYNYADYIKAKEIYSGLLEMEQQDFENNFLLILAGENYDTTNLYISNISTDEQKMYIDLKRKNSWNEQDTHIIAKIQKSLDREELEINNIPNIPSMSDKYVDINSLEKDYSMQQAIEDGCFVIEKNEIISDNKSQLDNFIDKCNQNVESNIRICDYQYGGRLSIIDIDYNNGRINSCCKCFDKENIQMYYNSGNKITKMVVFPNDDKNKSTEYYIIDEIGNQKIICIIK